MKRRMFTLLLALVLCLGLLPMGAMAAEGETVSITVDYAAQKDGKFLFAPVPDFNVSSDAAEKAGYTDQVASGVSALDVLAAAHAAKYGADIANYLSFDEAGNITKMFGESGVGGYAVNLMCPGPINSAAVESGQQVQFFFYGDADKKDDFIGFVMHPNTNYPNTSALASVDALTNYYLAGYTISEHFDNTPGNLKTYMTSRDNLQLCFVDNEGKMTDIDGYVSGSIDPDGKGKLLAGGVRIAWKDAGKYFVSAYYKDEAHPNVVLPLMRIQIMDPPRISKLSFFANQADYDANNAVHPDGIYPLDKTFDPNVYEGYSITFPDYIQYQRAFVAAYSDSIDGMITSTNKMSMPNGTAVSLTWKGGTNKNPSFSPNNYDTLRWEDNGYVECRYSHFGIGQSNGIAYKIAVSQYATLKGISIDEVVIEDFDPETLAQTGAANPLQSAANITALPYDEQTYKVTIGGQEVNAENKFTAAVPLEWNDQQKMEVPIKVEPTEASKYVTIPRTYTLTLDKMEVGDTPTITVQPKATTFDRYDKNAAQPVLSVRAVATGELTYQWYKAANDQSVDGATIIPGANNSEYTPNTGLDSLGTSYYFCRITNTGATQNNVTDSRIVAFEVLPDMTPTLTVKTQAPAITGYAEPNGFVYDLGQKTGFTPIEFEYTSEIPAEMEVDDAWSFRIRCVETRGSYSWVLNTKDCEVKDGVVSYTPTADAANDTGYYYYLYASHKRSDGRFETAESEPVYVFVTADHADPPTITGQLKDVECTEGDILKKFTISATKPATGGKLSYQWYSNSEKSVEGAEAIEGATKYSYQPQANVPGVTYYFYVVTNTLNGHTATATSNIAKVTVNENIENPLRALTGSGTAADPYQLSSAEDFNTLREIVNSGVKTEGLVFALTQNVTMPADWQGLGCLRPGSSGPEDGVNIIAFSGTLEGNNHTLTFAEGSRALVAYARELYINNLDIVAPYMADYALLSNYVVDYGDDGIYNTGCPKILYADNVNIKSGSVILKGGYLGGYGSGANYCRIANSTVEENVKIGFNKLTGQNANNSGVGSFMGEFNGGIINCVSYADVYGSSEVGGIAGAKGQSMGAASAQNCAFYGTVTATGNYVGGIIGSGYNSPSAPNTPVVTIKNCLVAADIQGADYVGGILGAEPSCEDCRDNGSGYIENNVFYGTIKATGTNVGAIIGYLRSFNENQGVENCYYLDTCGASKAIGYINTVYPNVKNPEDDCKAATAVEMKDGSVVEKLNASATSYKNWIQGKDYPIHSDEPVVYQLDVSGEYDNEYYIGEELNLEGLVLTADWTGGKRETLNWKSEGVKIEGFDSSNRAVQTLTISYGAAKAAIKVTVLKKPNGNTITVSFTLLGDEKHDSDTDGEVHTLSAGNLTEWIAKTEYEVDLNARVWDVIQLALEENKMTCDNPSGNYIKSITRDGVTLGEKENGVNSGWMYTLNGVHPKLGVSQQFLEDGDEIIYHYTDDYKQEGDAAYRNVEKLIDDIGEVTPDSKEAIETARAAYDALTDEEKEEVRNYDVLTAAEAKLAELTKPAEPTKPVEPTKPADMPFTDLASADGIAHWATDAIEYVYQAGLMNGTSGTTFEPDVPLNRGMMVTMLYRLENKPAVTGTSPFTDVAAGTWYTDAVIWANANGIAKGVTETSFEPTREITREQMATMLYRYANEKGYDTTDRAELNAYTDAASVSDYATDALRWSVKTGLIKGVTDTTLAPKGDATRAQTATVLMRFMENVAN